MLNENIENKNQENIYEIIVKKNENKNMNLNKKSESENMDFENKNEIINNENRIVKMSQIPERDEDFELEYVDDILILKMKNELYATPKSLEQRYGLSLNTIYNPINNCLSSGALGVLGDFFKPTRINWNMEAKKINHPIHGNVPVFVKLSGIEIAITQMPDLRNGEMPIIKRQVLAHLKELSEAHINKTMNNSLALEGDLCREELILIVDNDLEEKYRELQKAAIKEDANPLDTQKWEFAKSYKSAITGKSLTVNHKLAAKINALASGEIDYIFEVKRQVLEGKL